MTAILFVLSGLLVCVVSLQSLRMVQIAWEVRVAEAHRRKGGHVVWRSLDRYAVVLWCVAYAVGSACVITGLALVT